MTPNDLCSLSPSTWLRLTQPKILHPTRGYVPFEPRPYQGAILDDWDVPARLIVKARQLGFSQMFAAEAYWKAVYRGPRPILVVSRGQRWAMEFGNYVRSYCRPGELVKDNALELEWGNGSRLVIEAATKGAGRSLAASDVYLDEFAHAPWAQAIYQAVRPTVSTGGSITIFSSPNGRAGIGGTFWQLWMGQFGREGWRRYRCDWHWLHDRAWADRERAAMTAQQFASEYDCDFVASGGALFREDDITACFHRTLEAPRSRQYLFAADLAGEGSDATVCNVWEISGKPYQLIASERWVSGPFEDFYRRGGKLVDTYQPRDIIVDASGGYGAMAEEASRRWRRPVTPFKFTSGSKPEALSALQLLVEQHALAFTDPQLLTELRLYQQDDAGLVTDCVMTAALMATTLSTRKPGGVSL